MEIAIAIAAVLALVAVGAFASSWWRRREDADAVIGHTVDSRPAEDAAAEHAHSEAQRDATVVLRSSDDELRREVEQLAARGRAGK